MAPKGKSIEVIVPATIVPLKASAIAPVAVIKAVNEVAEQQIAKNNTQAGVSEIYSPKRYLPYHHH